MNPWGQLTGTVALPPSPASGRIYHMDPPKPRTKRDRAAPKKAKQSTIRNPWNLNSMQCQVAQLTADGLSNIEIGESLGMAIHSVEPCMRRIKRKMGNVNRVRAAILWDRFIRLDGQQ